MSYRLNESAAQFSTLDSETGVFASTFDETDP
ncbi:hypothetical protein PF005_g18571 [Phytophthora fragariae]|uniref:Uncharacterized protein n=1 Tax=Phytophthora fragariae TaxID=53985 RepID=A0A6A4ABU7_9STRA|nr:hypothetical protein PF003_g17185 [Phytophthora fragariae]KAE9089603.1 hypothetical protein PF007_g19537 [Phytophthora fragariae]KAE9098913.1 hypothetical protein PF006_g23252 [Phytophthora fragariae]KAE9192153.1 hypothetical protein PF005_g18571 [Phytophthora fragariae]KAE9256466.1 hypothetical protein PF002_g1845 [Phytophthora fragariae]